MYFRNEWPFGRGPTLPDPERGRNQSANEPRIHPSWGPILQEVAPNPPLLAFAYKPIYAR